MNAWFLLLFVVILFEDGFRLKINKIDLRKVR